MTLLACPSPEIYLGTNNLSVYPYSARIFDPLELVITKTEIAEKIVTTLVYLDDYTVDGVGEFTGGNVTLLAGNLTENEKIEIDYAPIIVQPQSFANQNSFYPERHEKGFDRLTNICCYLRRLIANIQTSFDELLDFFSNVDDPQIGDRIEYDGEKWVNVAHEYSDGALLDGGGAYDGFVPVQFSGILLSLPGAGTWRIWGTFATDPDVESWFGYGFRKTDAAGDHSSPPDITHSTGANIKAGAVNTLLPIVTSANLKLHPIAEIVLSVPGPLEVYIIPFGKAVGDGAGNIGITGRAYAQRISLANT